MKLQLDVPPTWTAEPLGEDQRRYLVPGGARGAVDLVVVVRESLPLPLELAGWPMAALSQLKTSLLGALPTELASSGAAAPGAAQWRVQVQDTATLTTTSGWPATLVQATLIDEREQPLAGCLAALYRFLAYGAEALIVATDRVRLATLREQLRGVLASGRALWPPGEPASLHQMLHDEPTDP